MYCTEIVSQIARIRFHGLSSVFCLTVFPFLRLTSLASWCCISFPTPLPPCNCSAPSLSGSRARLLAQAQGPFLPACQHSPQGPVGHGAQSLTAPCPMLGPAPYSKSQWLASPRGSWPYWGTFLLDSPGLSHVCIPWHWLLVTSMPVSYHLLPLLLSSVSLLGCWYTWELLHWPLSLRSSASIRVVRSYQISLVRWHLCKSTLSFGKTGGLPLPVE